MTADLLPLLSHSTLMVSAALLAVLALRGAWLRCFGAGNVMLLWLSVPAALLALLLPAPVQHVEGGALAAFTPESVVPSPAIPGIAAQPPVTVDTSDLLLALWLVGVAMMAALLTFRQWQYRRSLGRLDARPDGSFRSLCNDTGPALVGALRPRIVLPADFERRYTPRQQSLILAHERCHLKRGDAQLTLLACVIRCLFWFNPLVHLAWSRFRIDQELACDAAVLHTRPESRRDYAEAMLSTQLATCPLPVGCTWLTDDPLRRRITMLYVRPPGRIQLLAGTVLALTAGTAAALGTWSSQEPQLRFASIGTPSLELSTVATPPVAPESGLPERAMQVTTPSLASVAAPHTANMQAKLAPPAPTMESKSAAAAPSAPSAAADGQTPAPAPAAEPQSSPERTQTVDVEPARLVQASRPSFPRTFNKPELVSYPGMPDSELPGPGWQPEGNLWRMEVRVMLDEQGKPTQASVTDNDLSNDGMVRRFERLALRAVRNWRYEPARIDGDPVASELLMAFHFEFPAIGKVHDIGDPPYQVNKPIRYNSKYTNR